MEHVHSRFSIVVGLPLLHNKSAPALPVSRPAQRSLTLRPARSPSRPCDPLHRRLQRLRHFVTSTAASNATGWLTLEDSRPHVLFGTVLVKHLLDLISSFPQPVQFLRFDFGEAHRGRAIRIQG